MIANGGSFNNVDYYNSGTIILKGSNTYSGGTGLYGTAVQIGVNSAGTVSSITSSALGTGTVTFQAGANLSSDSTTARTILNAIVFNSNVTLGDATRNGKLTFSGSASLNSASRTIAVNPNSEAQFDGIITDGTAAAGISKSGSGTLTLTNTANSFSGNIAINANGGNLKITSGAALGSSTNARTFTNTGAGTQLLVLDSNGGPDITLGSNISFSTSAVNGAIRNDAGNNTINGAFSLTSGNGNTKIISNGGSLKLTGNITTVSGAGNNRVFDLDGTSTGANEVSGIISDGGGYKTGVSKNGVGTWKLSGPNTYSNGTTVNSGSLILANANALGASAGSLAVNGGTLDLNGYNPTVGLLSGSSGALITTGSNASIDLTVSGTGSSTYAGVISNGAGTVGLAKADTGTLTLAGLNTYSGATAINGGTLNVNGSISSASAVSVAFGAVLSGSGTVGGSVGVVDGGIITPGSNGSGTLALGNVTFNGTGAVNFVSNGSAMNTSLAATGTMTTGAGTVTVNVSGPAAWTTGTYNLISYGSWGGVITDFAKGTIPAIGGHRTADLGTTGPTNGFITLMIGGDNLVWTGSSSGVWSQSAVNAPYNWTLGTTGSGAEFLDQDVVIFKDGAGNTTNVTIDDNTVTPSSVVFDNNTQNYTLQSGSGYGIAGATPLYKSGTGTLTITNTNTYTGGTTLSGGTINVNSAEALGGASGNLTFTGSGGTLQLGATIASSTRNYVLNASGKIDTNGNDLTNTGVVSGTGSLTKIGNGTLTLGGANSYSGGTTITSGTLAAASANALGTGSVTNNATLNLTVNPGGSNVTYSGISSAMGGNGVVNVTLGTGFDTVILNGDYSGFTGTWNIGVGAAAGAGKIQMNGLDNSGATLNMLSNATIYVSTSGTHNAALVLNGGDTGESLGQLRLDGGIWAGPVTLSGTITGSGDGFVGSTSSGTITGSIGETGGSKDLSKVGSGTITLSGSNSFTGGAIVNGGVLTLTNSNALGAISGPNSVASGASLELANGVTIANEFVTIIGTGASFNGALRAGTGNGTWSGSVILGSADARIGALDGTTLTITGAINGSGANQSVFISGQNGNGTVILNPTLLNTYSGTTGIIRGTLKIGKTDALPTGTILDVDSSSGVADAVAFDLNGFNQTVGALQDSATTNVNGVIRNNVASTTSVLTVDGTTNTQYDGTITTGSGSVRLVKSGSGTLTLTAANNYTGGTTISGGRLISTRATASGTMSIAGGATLEYNIASGSTAQGPSSYTGAGTILKTGTGTLYFGGGNSNVGMSAGALIDVQAGVFQLGNFDSQSDTFTGNLSDLNIASGAALDAYSTSVTVDKLTGSGTYKAGYFGPRSLTVGANNGSSTFSGTITGNGINADSQPQLFKTGTGTLTLTGALNFTGAFGGDTVRVNGGTTASPSTLTISPTSASSFGYLGATMNIGSATSDVVVVNQTSGTAVANNLAIGQKGVATYNLSGTAVVNANRVELAFDGPSNGTGAATLNVSGSAQVNIYSNGNLLMGQYYGRPVTVNQSGGNVIFYSNAGTTRGGTGSLRFASGNQTSAYNLNGGTLSIPAITWVAAGGGAGGGNGTINFNGGTMQITSGSFALPTGTANGQPVVMTKILDNGGTIDSFGLAVTYAGPIDHGGTNAIDGGLTKIGAGSLTLTASNTFTGPTKITSGTLGVSNDMALQNSAFDTSGTGTMTLSVTTPTFGGLKGSTDLATAISSGYGSVTALALNPIASATNTYTGVISNGAAGMTLTKTGLGTQVLSGSNTYTGLTSVNNGTLAFDVSETLTGGLNVATSGTAVLTAHTGGAANVKVLDITGLTISGTTAFVGGGKDLGGLAAPAPVPEPGTVGLLVVGVIGGLLLRRRNRCSRPR